MLGLPSGDEVNGVGQLFLLIVYGFILFKAAVLIGDGSEKLLLIYGPGIVGGLIIPVLGAVPDGAIVLVSGLGSDAQSQVSIGVGTLAGSTIMLLTIPWALGLILGARDYDEKTGRAALTEANKPKFTSYSLSSCVTVYNTVTSGAKIMMVTALSYFIITIPAIIYRGNSNEAHKEHIPALIGIIVCGLAFIGYSVYQIYDSNAQVAQERKTQKAKFDMWKTNVSKKFGRTDQAIRAVFERFDNDKNGTIDRNELARGFEQMGLQVNRQQIFEIMHTMNVDDDEDTLTFEEFSSAIKTWSKYLSV